MTSPTHPRLVGSPHEGRHARGQNGHIGFGPTGDL